MKLPFEIAMIETGRYAYSPSGSMSPETIPFAVFQDAWIRLDQIKVIQPIPGERVVSVTLFREDDQAVTTVFATPFDDEADHEQTTEQTTTATPPG
jgi:hypothetical protein